MFDPKERFRNPGLLRRRLYPKAGPVIVRAADVPRLRPKVFWREDSCPSQGYQSAYCIG